MRRTLLVTVAAAAAIVPAALGVVGNTSFSESVPAVVPVGATLLPSPTPSSTEHHRGRGADDGPSAAASGTGSPTADDHGRRHGGHGADDGPGDDRTVRATSSGAGASSTASSSTAHASATA